MLFTLYALIPTKHRHLMQFYLLPAVPTHDWDLLSLGPLYLSDNPAN